MLAGMVLSLLLMGRDTHEWLAVSSQHSDA